MFNVPKVRNEIDPKNVHIDGTPNDGYALRILEYYRLRCNEKWVVDGLDEVERSIYDAMNDVQDKRAKILDDAIAKLKSPVNNRPESKSREVHRRIMTSMTLDTTHPCYGMWQKHNSVCILCRFKVKCREVQ